MTQTFASADAVAEAIIADVGKTIVLGLPLGLGKANHIANALFARAVADRSIKLTIFTALTLEKPRPSGELERRFIGPVLERLFGGYPELAYAKALHANALPPNIEVNEFFFLAGRWLGSPTAQQNYISANYTHAFSYLLVARRQRGRPAGGKARRRWRCTLQPQLQHRHHRRPAEECAARAAANFRVYGAGQRRTAVHARRRRRARRSEFAGILDGPAVEFPLFAPPRRPDLRPKYAIGLHVAGLVRDGGTLQIGIGQIGDALAQALIVRHRDNAEFLRGRRNALGAASRPLRNAARSTEAFTASARCSSRRS